MILPRRLEVQHLSKDQKVLLHHHYAVHLLACLRRF